MDTLYYPINYKYMFNLIGEKIKDVNIKILNQNYLSWTFMTKDTKH